MRSPELSDGERKRRAAILGLPGLVHFRTRPGSSCGYHADRGTGPRGSRTGTISGSTSTPESGSLEWRRVSTRCAEEVHTVPRKRRNRGERKQKPRGKAGAECCHWCAGKSGLRPPELGDGERKRRAAILGLPGLGAPQNEAGLELRTSRCSGRAEVWSGAGTVPGARRRCTLCRGRVEVIG